MADTLRPASLLLGAVCLWAACVLLLALAGLGSRVADSGAPAQPPPIPKVALRTTPSRLGLLLDYAEVGQRPLLNPDRRPGPAPAAEGGSDELDVILTSVLITPRLQLAILTDAKDSTSKRVRVGENVAGSNWRLARLEPRKAVLEGPGGERTLDLRVFDGQGGLPPTALGGNAGGVASAGGVARTDNAVGSDAGQAPGSVVQPAVPRPAMAVNGVRAAPVAPTPTPQTQPPPSSQDAQIEAIRRRIEARRAQMRAEAGAAGSQDR